MLPAQNALTLRVPTLLNLLSSMSRTKFNGWLFYSKGVKFALKINKKLLSNSDNILGDFFIIIEKRKLYIIFFQVGSEIFIQNNINIPMEVPERCPTFTRFCKEVFILYSEINKSVSHITKTISSLDCYT